MNAQRSRLLEESLREAGQCYTKQPPLYGNLADSDLHLTVDELFARSRVQDQGTGLATIDRTWSALKEAGLVALHFLGRNHEKEHLERASATEHLHFTCNQCGRVYEFETELLRLLRDQLCSSRGWELNDACMCFEGLCEHCARNRPRW